jgi:hypothetical protein
VAHLLGGKESQLVTFNVVLGTCWGANEVMHVHDGQPSMNETGIHPRNLQVRFVNESCMDRPWSPGLWGEPRLDHQDTTSTQVLRHTLDGSGEVLQGFDVPNRAEETGNNVKRPSQVEVCHARVMQRDTEISLASNGK